MNRNAKNKEILNASLTETKTFSRKSSTSPMNEKHTVINGSEFVVPWQCPAEQKREQVLKNRMSIVITDILQYYF